MGIKGPFWSKLPQVKKKKKSNKSSQDFSFPVPSGVATQQLGANDSNPLLVSQASGTGKIILECQTTAAAFWVCPEQQGQHSGEVIIASRPESHSHGKQHLIDSHGLVQEADIAAVYTWGPTVLPSLPLLLLHPTAIQ